MGRSLVPAKCYLKRQKMTSSKTDNSVTLKTKILEPNQSFTSPKTLKSPPLTKTRLPKNKLLSS